MVSGWVGGVKGLTGTSGTTLARHVDRLGTHNGRTDDLFTGNVAVLQDSNTAESHRVTDRTNHKTFSDI